jgi:hypothetical protein
MDIKMGEGIMNSGFEKGIVADPALRDRTARNRLKPDLVETDFRDVCAKTYAVIESG